MTQILIKGETVYQCDTCNRKIRVLSSRDGIDITNRCIITNGCVGKLTRLTRSKDVNNTPAFPLESPGVQDWFQRRVIYDHVQPIRSREWTVQHNLNCKPNVYVYTTKQIRARSTPPEEAVGNMWYKPTSTTTIPTGTGLFTYTGNKWELSHNTIGVGIVGSNVYEYQELTTAYNVEVVDGNTLKITLPESDSGRVQCVALSSQSTYTPSQTSVVDEYYQVSNNGEITIATLTSTPYITLTLRFIHSDKSSSTPIIIHGIDTTPSIYSPWATTKRLFINGKTYSVRSFNIANNTQILSNIASGLIDPSNAAFVIEGIPQGSQTILMLLSKSPYSTVDRIVDKIIDISDLNADKIGMFYRSGEVVVNTDLVKNTYPLITPVDI